jgi:hypothetical protein
MSGTVLASLLLANGNPPPTAPPLSPQQTMALFKRSVERARQDIARLEKEPAVQRDLQVLQQAVARAKTPDDLLRNPRVIKLLMEALGLADQAANVGLARAVLMSKLSDLQSLANRLPDRRWKAAAQRLNFAAAGLDTVRDPAVMAELKAGILQNRRISGISAQSPAVADALYVRDLPSGQTPSLFAVLGDKVMRRVATTVASLPQELALQSVEAQARTLGARFDPAQFADPKKRDALINRYLIVSSTAQTGLQVPDVKSSPLLRLFV